VRPADSIYSVKLKAFFDDAIGENSQLSEPDYLQKTYCYIFSEVSQFKKQESHFLIEIQNNLGDIFHPELLIFSFEELNITQ